jgi:hypothetical protein
MNRSELIRELSIRLQAEKIQRYGPDAVLTEDQDSRLRRGVREQLLETAANQMEVSEYRDYRNNLNFILLTAREAGALTNGGRNR